MNDDESNQLPARVHQKPICSEIKAAYLSGEGSLRTLAKRFNVSLNTLEKKCRREGWRQQMAALDGKVTAAAVEMAVERGREMGLTAAAFLARAIKEMERLLDQIQTLLNQGTVDVESLQKIVLAWRALVEMGRKLFELDKHEANLQVNMMSMLNLTEIKKAPPRDLDDDSEP